jgi:acetoin utilization deacetylase AcuC-like enzyme
MLTAFYCDTFVLPLPDGHRFPMAKYALLRARIEAHRQALGVRLELPPAASEQDVLRVHCPAYWERVRSGTLSESEQRRIGFPWSSAMVQRTLRVSGATTAALRRALQDGVAVSLAGGTHHADYDHGAGYCVLNDSVVAARHLQHAGLVKRVLVIDLDVHQGNGTAALCAGDPSIFTFSMHGEKNYPAVKAMSDLDIALPSGCGDSDYLKRLMHELPRVLTLTQPDCAIYLAGADPYEGDQLGFLKLTKAGLAARDHYVLNELHSRGLACAITMAGGYAANVADIVDIHYATVQCAAAFAQRWTQSTK